MASLILPLVSPIFLVSHTRLPYPMPSNKIATTRKIFCSVSSHTRRSSNYAPTCWDYNFLQSLHNSHTDVRSNTTREVDDAREIVRRMIINDVTAPLEKLELIDAIQRLGLKYQFEREIRRALESIYQDSEDAWFSNDLHAASLRFRLLRQYKYEVHQDVFDNFKDETGDFRESLCGDINGLLSMYEASFLGLEDEPIVDKANEFATAKLKEVMAAGDGDNMSSNLARKIGHALEMPLHWRLTKIEARWFAETYEQEQNMNPNLLKMAKLDYNMVQSIYQKEVADLVRWWMDTGLGEINFVRDRPVEGYFWSLGIVSEPSFGDYRVMGAKVHCLITTIDDVYDIYAH